MNQKMLLLFGYLLLMCLPGAVTAQDTSEASKGWHLRDKQTDDYYGISLNKAYEFLKSKNLKSSKVTVAIIDGGIDTLHEDLAPLLWSNRKEIYGNGKDDDKNGYADDRYGWGYLTGKDGKAVTQDSDEGLRVYHRYKTKYAGKEIDEKKLIPVEQREYRMWKKAQGFIEGATEGIDINRQYGFLKSVSEADSILVKAMGKPIYNGHQLDSFVPNNNAEKKAKNMIFDILKRNNVLDATGQDLIANIKFFINDSETKLRNVQTPPKNYRLEVTGDDEYNFSARNYGSPDVMGQRPDHGTHVGGIVGAVRNNGKGIDGVADNVLLMPLLVVPDGDEHDKDIALGIRYAVDNGAKVVNMSFGKSFSPGKQWIDDAVEYAQKKGVLLVHAAGNEAKDLDADGNDSYPNQRLINGKWATNWITVGASGDPKLGTIAAPFSNYGKKNVDVFAPGMSIYSTLPGGNVYGFNQGTSMAAPVVSGIAALLKSYFPALTPEQLKMIIEKSVVVPDYKTPKPGAGEGEAMVNLADLSKTGGIVNAYNAVKMAYEMTAGKKTSGPKAKMSKGK